MILKYKKQIINAENNINDSDSLFVTIKTKYNLKNETQEKSILIEYINGYNNFIGDLQFDNLDIAQRLVEDIKESYKNGVEFYNIETKIQQLIRENINEK